VDLQLVVLTVVAILSRPKALAGVQRLLRKLRADEQLIKVAGRSEPLAPYPPPSMQAVETRTSTSGVAAP
jgi:hypothetical protein